MTDHKKSQVVFCQENNTESNWDDGSINEGLLKEALAELIPNQGETTSKTWALKVSMAAMGPVSVTAQSWIKASRESLEAAGHSLDLIFDNLSITTAGLDTVDGLLARAEKLGLKDSFVVGDNPDEGCGDTLSLSPECALPEVKLSAVATRAEGLMFLNSVRPHPYLGLSGALFALGNGVLDRKSKLLLHRDIRPTVDTPLCAGCGSCLATCIFDAITIKAGRAFIDHKLCTGCGECMTACHLAGISPEDAARIPRFQKQVAETALAVARQSKAAKSHSLLYVNFLNPIPRQFAGGFGRDRQHPEVKGVLVSADPVALDQATWDLLVKGRVHGLRQWSGFLQEPGPLMKRAEALGLGSSRYKLQIRS